MSQEGYAESWLDWEATSGGRNVLRGTVEEIRTMYDGLIQALISMMPRFTDNVDTMDGEVDGIKYRLYMPKNVSGPLPTAIWTHGGGYTLGNLESDHSLCGVVAEHTKSIVVNIDYRLAPEAKWPAQLEDCMKIYKWAHTNASSFGGDATKFYTIGASAGGGLAFQIANQVVQDPSLKHSLKGIAALVPFTAHWESIPEHYRTIYTAYNENAEGVPILTKDSMEIFYRAVAADPNDPDFFTILSPYHKNFPPTYITSCQFDPLRDDAYVMEEALRVADVPTKHDHYKGFPHYFWIIPAIPEGQCFIQNLLTGIKWLQSQM